MKHSDTEDKRTNLKKTLESSKLIEKKINPDLLKRVFLKENIKLNSKKFLLKNLNKLIRTTKKEYRIFK
jgi:hypothetical protein